MTQFLQQLVNGISTGAIYALIAVGYTMVYGVLRLINFAHGDVYMIGAMTGFYAATRWFHIDNPSWSGFLLVLLTAMIVCGILGALIEFFAYRPLRDQPRIVSLITAIGISMLLEFGGQADWMFGPNPKAFPNLIPGFEEHPDLLHFHGVVVDKVDAIILLTALVLMALLWLFVTKTRTGLALRAVSFRFDTAALMGVNVNRIISFTFVLGSVLAAAAGVLVAVRAPKVDPLMGLIPGLKAFIAAVLGGIGSIPGAVAGGLLLGLTEVMVAGYFPQGSQYRDAVAFVILIVVLLVKPSGCSDAMESKKSDNLNRADHQAARDPRPSDVASVPSRFSTAVASRPTPLHAWIIFAVSNLWVIAAIGLLIPLGHVLENGARVDPYYFRIGILVGINVILALSLQLINGISGQFSLGHAGFMAVGAYLAGYATKTFGATINSDGDPVPFSDPGGVIGYFIALLITLIVAGALLLAIFIAIGKSKRIAAGLPGILLVIVMAWIVIDVSVNAAHAMPNANIPAVSSGSSNTADNSMSSDSGTSSDDSAGPNAPVPPTPLFSGPRYLVWSRLLDLLVGLFDALLKMAPRLSALLLGLPDLPRAVLTFFAALLGGGLVAAVAGLLVGLPTLRLRGDYLAIATLGFGEIIRVAIVNSQALGGATGLQTFPYHLNDDDGHAIRFLFPWVWGAVIFCFVIIWRLSRSPTGRGLIAVREDEIAAAATGINPTRHKVLAFVVGAFFAGIAGALYAHFDGYLSTNSYGFMKSVELVVMVTLGGLGSLWGAAIAAAALTILPELLDNASRVLPGHLAHAAGLISQNRLVIYALLLVIIMLARARWRDVAAKLFPPRESASPEASVTAS